MSKITDEGSESNDEHNVIRMSNGQYRCDNCCEIGEGLWAVSHQNVPAAPLTPKGDGVIGVNYLRVQSNPIYVSTGYEDDTNINIFPRRTPPSISFVIGTKRLTFTLNNDGLIDVGYDPEDFTAGALRVVEEVKRLLSER